MWKSQVSSISSGGLPSSSRESHAVELSSEGGRREGEAARGPGLVRGPPIHPPQRSTHGRPCCPACSQEGAARSQPPPGWPGAGAVRGAGSEGGGAGRALGHPARLRRSWHSSRKPALALTALLAHACAKSVMAMGWVLGLGRTGEGALWLPFLQTSSPTLAPSAISHAGWPLLTPWAHFRLQALALAPRLPWAQQADLRIHPSSVTMRQTCHS